VSNDLQKYLDPKVLAKITRLDLQARLVVAGFISGLHKSPFHGFSVEFASHREYAPGDDTRHIDWKVQAKTDRYYVKQYEEETNLKATFLLDASESMHYGHDGMTKYAYAVSVAASLAFLLLQQQDAVGLAIFDDELRRYIPPRPIPTTSSGSCTRWTSWSRSRKPRWRRSVTPSPRKSPAAGLSAWSATCSPTWTVSSAACSISVITITR